MLWGNEMLVKPWLGCLGLLLTILSFSVRADSGLNGMAVYSELGNELFIAALYSEQTGTNAQELINGSYPKRIELKFLSAAGMTERQFSRLWRESIAINNDQNILVAQADNVLYFEGLIRDRLEANDHLVIDFVPARGVAISLNSVELGHIEDDAFFGLLLRSWIGLVPSSTKFRDDLLSVTLVDAALAIRFNNIHPRNARVDVAKQWKLASTVTEDKALDEAPVAAPVIKPEPVVAPKVAEVAAVSAPVIVPVEKPLESVKAAPVKPEPVKPKPASPIVAGDYTSNNTNAAVNNTANDQTVSRAQELLAKQFYMADVFKKIYSNVSYPKRAQELQQAGTVRLAVVIDALGKIKTIAPIEESQFSLLNKAALAAVEKAAPFSPLPEGFNLTELELSVPITFSLAGI